jgi:hypothetical protein
MSSSLQHDIVLDTYARPVFSGMPEDVLKWLQENPKTRPHPAVIYIGSTRQTVSPDTYFCLDDMRKHEKVVEEKRRKEIMELMGQALSINLELSAYTYTELSEQFTGKIMEIFAKGEDE